MGGILGLQRNGAFVGLSVFGAGNLAVVALKGVLSKAGFTLFDTVEPSNLSRNFNGEFVLHGDYLQRLTEAMRKKVTFPAIPDKTSIAQYIKPLTNG